MRALVRLKRFFGLASILLMFVTLIGVSTASAEKVGVLVLHSGMDEEYKPDWMVGYFEHLFLFFPPGFYAGGPLEGGDCYTLIHYASPEEADMCTDIGIPVTEGTPIDIFCNTYDPAVTNIHSIRDHFNSGDGTIVSDCFDDPIGIGNAMMTTHSTIDPVTGEEIIGPHIDGGPGIGVAEFAEIGAFGRMEDLVHAFPGERNPYREQIVKWIFGERYQTIYPSYLSRYGWPVDNRSNIWDELEAAILADPTIPEGTEVVFRQGSESYMWNRDIYGNPSAPISDSTEQGLRDLILTENVDRVIVMAALASYTNLNNFGHCWNDENGDGISAVPGKTYYECIMDTTDGVGPGDEALRDELVGLKPFDKYKMPYPEIWEMVEAIEAERGDPEFTIHDDLTFTTDYGDETTYPEAWLEMLNFTVNNYGINDNGTNLKVVLALHGYNGGFIWPPSASPEGAAWCDVYHREAFLQAQETVDYIKANFTWSNGAFDVTMAESEYAEPSSEGGINDDPALNPPFGNRWSIGEIIDDSIHGTYINELGAVVNNNDDSGKTKYEQIVVLPFTWDAESIDTIEHLRHVTGNMEYQFIQGQWMWARSGHEEHEEEPGEDPHGHGDSPFDQYYFTEEIFDATEHCTVPEGGVDPVCKGDPVNPSRLVVTGCALSLPEGPWRSNFTQAAVDSIISAMKNPDIGGELDEVCWEESICTSGTDSDSDGISDVCDNCPDNYNPAQEDSYPPLGNGVGDACECEADVNCDGTVDMTDQTKFLEDFGRSMYYYPCNEVGTGPGTGDEDGDGIPNDQDNCWTMPNGNSGGFCAKVLETGLLEIELDVSCTWHTQCKTALGDGYFCELYQIDMNGNGFGDVCECESDFDMDGDVDGTDVTVFVNDNGRQDCPVSHCSE